MACGPTCTILNQEITVVCDEDLGFF
jgi:hypothetical protein